MMEWWLGGSLAGAGELVWLTRMPWSAVAVVGVLAMWVLGLLGGRSQKSRVLERILWTLSMAGLLLALLRPTWIAQEGRVVKGRLAVLVDRSLSMDVVEKGTQRSEAVADIVERLKGDATEIYQFDGTLKPGMPAAYDGAVTDFHGALQALADRKAGERLAGVVILSDGIDRGALRAGWKAGEEPEPPRLPGPLTIYQVGSADKVSDLSVVEVHAGGFAYIHAPFTIDAEIQGTGFEGRTIPVELLKDGGLVASEEVQLDAEGHGQVSFDVRVDRPGRFSYLVQVPTYSQDAVPGNNAAPVVVSVVRDKIRVLQVAGSPSWDVKFLRRFLKGDPSVDLVSFFILRTHEDTRRRYDENELSLIQFPYEQLFRDELATFDMIVFQNFDYQPYFGGGGRALLENVRQVVEEQGHAFVMIGGDRSFQQGDYQDSPLESILPVSLQADAQPSIGPFQPQLTDAGKRHPVTRLVAGPEENLQWWARLVDMDGTHTGLQAKPNAAVLLSHPDLKGSDGAPLPVLTVMEAGYGRSMALSVDSSWRWSLSEAAQGHGNQAYLRFWKGAMRWLIKDESTHRLTVDTSRENYSVGDEVRVVVRSRGEQFEPLGNVQVQVDVQGPQQASTTVTTNEAGEAIVPLDLDLRGSYRVKARQLQADEEALEVEAETVFAITDRQPELAEVSADGDFLRWLAARTGGRYYAPDEKGPPLRDGDADRRVFDRHEVPVWRAPLLIAFILLTGGLAFLLRRRAGLR